MTRAGLHATLCATLLAAGCAGSTDHFYTLTTLPDTERAPSTIPTIHVLLGVTVPALVDRAEMVVGKSRNGILVLDHERWAVPLSEQVSQTLARDIERHRDDILIGDRGFDQARSPPVNMKVDIVRMDANRGGQARIEAHWRIVDTVAGVDEIGSAAYSAPTGDSDYAAVARAYSQTLSALAGRLAQAVPRR